MRRSAIVGCLLAFIVLGSRPDAAFVPAPRTPDNAAPRRAEAARLRSAPVAKAATVLPPRVSAAAAFVPPAAAAMPAAPMQPPVGRTATTTDLTVTPNPGGF